MTTRRTWILAALSVLSVILSLYLLFHNRKADCNKMVGSVAQGHVLLRSATWRPIDRPGLLRVQDDEQPFEPDKEYVQQTPETPCTMVEQSLGTVRGVSLAVSFMLLLSTFFSYRSDRLEERQRRRRKRRDRHHRRRREREEREIRERQERAARERTP